MAQAKRRKSAKSSPKKRRSQGLSLAYQAFKQSFGFFASGVLVGAVGLLFWQGYQSPNPGDLGSGLRDIIRNSRNEDAAARANPAPPPEPVLVDNTPKGVKEYGFYTVLPAFEEVLPEDAVSPPPVVAVHKPTPANKEKPANSKATAPKAAQFRPAKAQSSYMLQVASLGREQDAEKLKARLALQGLRASVQKVSVDSKKYYRVRVGPYAEFNAMKSDDSKLTRMGFKAIRMRISSPG